MSQAGNKNVLPWDYEDVKFGLFETVQFLDMLLCSVECSIFKTKKAKQIKLQKLVVWPINAGALLRIL